MYIISRNVQLCLKLNRLWSRSIVQQNDGQIEQWWSTLDMDVVFLR